jgi:hypothetical protein
MLKMTRQYQILILTVSFLLLSIVGVVTYAWIVLINRTDSFIATAAKVKADYVIELEGVAANPEFFVVTDTYTMIKSGVFRINVTDINADDYIENLRITIKVNSTVDTYIRVSIIDALTLATIDFSGNRGEVSIVDQPINYSFSRKWDVNGVIYEDLYDAEVALGGITANDTVIRLDDWFDNRLNDGYYYYPKKIERSTFSSELSIPFIEAYDGLEFKVKPFGYTLQIAIIVEAIQAGHNAPLYNWGLLTPPWGGTWE